MITPSVKYYPKFFRKDHLFKNSVAHIQHARPKGCMKRSSLLPMGPAKLKRGHISNMDIRSMEDWWFMTTTAAPGSVSVSPPSIWNSIGI